MSGRLDPYEGLDALEGLDPALEVLLVQGEALEKLAKHKIYGKMTSHEILARLRAEREQGGGLLSQAKIMIDLGMFTASNFRRVPFTDLGRVDYTVWTYCWADSPWVEMWDGVKQKAPEAHQDSYWFDIFCLDQFNERKMETIKRSDDIYQKASKYYVVGLACFDRLWCLAEVGCRTHQEITVVVDFKGFLYQRETAYKAAKLSTDPTFHRSRCTEESDRAIVEERIVKRCGSTATFDTDIKKVADSLLNNFREVTSPSSC